VTVAFVDIDGTLTRSNMSFLFGRHMYAMGKISLVQAFFCAFLYGCHLVGILQVAQLHRAVFRVVFRGKKRSDVVAWAQQFFALQGASLFRSSMIEELEALKKKNVHTILLSSSPDFLVSFIAEAFGGLDFRATEYVCNGDGFFSQVGMVMSGLQKRCTAFEYREKGCNNIVAITDSLQDRPLLEVSDEVVVVCPGISLKRMAREKGWRIIPR
jgi:phosphoserine phosphatase